eukprot:gene6448-13026_t
MDSGKRLRMADPVPAIKVSRLHAANFIERSSFDLI